MEMTTKEIEQARNYLIASGSNPEDVKLIDVERARRHLEYMAEQCARYGSD